MKSPFLTTNRTEPAKKELKKAGSGNLRPSLVFFMIIILLMTLLLSSSTMSLGLLFYDVDISTSDGEKDADRKHPAYYELTVINEGENDDTYELSYSFQNADQADKWVVSFTDYFEERIEINVKAGKTTVINLTVRPSCGCEEGNKMTVDITARSKADSSTFDRVSVTTLYATVTDPDPNGGTDPLDSDNDGWSDDDELKYGTNPYDPFDYPILDQDSDGDGLSDTAETTWGTNPFDPDTDGDGDNDKMELEQGTDPLDPGSKSGSSSSTDDGSGDSDDEKKNLFGMTIEDDIYLIIIPVLVIIVVVSILVLIYVWKHSGPYEDEDEEDVDEDFNGRTLQETKSRTETSRTTKTVESDSKNSTEKYKVLEAKLERTGGGKYKCPECSEDFNLKEMKKHVLRKHHRRLKRL